MSAPPALAAYQDPLVGRLIGERYIVLRELAAGDAARLLLGEDARMGRQAVIKLVNPALTATDEAYERLRERAARASLIIHRSVAPIYDIGRTPDGLLFIAAASPEGVPLPTLLDAGDGRGARALPPARAFSIVQQAAAALAVAHGLGVAHGNLTADDIFIGEGDRVQLIGFGIGRLDALPGEEPDAADDVRRLTGILHRMLGSAPAAAALARRFTTAEELRDAVADAALRLTQGGRRVELPPTLARHGASGQPEGARRQRMVVTMGVALAIVGAAIAAVRLFR
ncbi:MAG TPA: hypothetical protein VFS05_14380 [Gemmatimonadaceae bacterium]|nr:hypothetical protein [Gemmatimonadaceae bacterium]